MDLWLLKITNKDFRFLKKFSMPESHFCVESQNGLVKLNFIKKIPL